MTSEPRTPPASPGHRFLLTLLVVASALLVLIIWPFAGSLFAAAVFAVVLQPLQRRATAAFGDRPRLAAASLTMGLTLIVLVPMAWLTTVVVRQAVEGADWVAAVVEQEGTEGLIARLPPGVAPLGRRLAAALQVGMLSNEARASDAAAADAADGGDGRDAAKPAAAGSHIGQLLGYGARTAKATLLGLASLFLQVGVLIVTLFFLLAQGTSLVRWIVAAVPLRESQMQQFLVEFHDVTVAVFVSTVTSAAIQATVAAIGYLIAGTPLFAVTLMITFVAAFIPAIGGATIVVAVGVWLLLTDSFGMGIFLIAWGLIPVALCDNLAKPLLAERRLRLPASVVFFAMLGGLTMFGPLGVVAGPLIVSFFLVVLRALKTEGAGSETAVAAPS